MALSVPGLKVKPLAPVAVKVEAPVVVRLPMLTRLPEASILWVPAPAPVLMPVVPFMVVPVMVLAETNASSVFRVSAAER